MSRLPTLFSLKKLAGNRRLFLLCLLLFLVSAVLSFGWFFPAEVVQRNLIGRASQLAGLNMQGSHAAMVFPLGLKLDLYVEPEVEQLNGIEIRDLKITPSWTSLVTGHPALSLDGTVAQGGVKVLAARDGSVDLRMRQVRLAPLQRRDNDYLLGGRLSGSLQSDNAAAGIAGKGAFSIELLDASVDGLQMLGLPSGFDLGRIQLAGKFNQRRVSIERIVASEGLLEVDGGGTILVGVTPDRTRLNLNMRLRPGPSTPESVRELIKLSGARPTTDGSYLLRLGGTLANPQVR